MAARDVVRLVEVCKVGGGLGRDEVGFEVGGGGVGEGAADDLFYDAAVDVDAAAELCHLVEQKKGGKKAIE